MLLKKKESTSYNFLRKIYPLKRTSPNRLSKFIRICLPKFFQYLHSLVSYRLLAMIQPRSNNAQLPLHYALSRSCVGSTWIFITYRALHMRGGGNKFRVKHNRHPPSPEGGGSRELLENKKTVGKGDRRPTLVGSSILRRRNSN